MFRKEMEVYLHPRVAGEVVSPEHVVQSLVGDHHYMSVMLQNLGANDVRLKFQCYNPTTHVWRDASTWVMKSRTYKADAIYLLGNETKWRFTASISGTPNITEADDCQDTIKITHFDMMGAIGGIGTGVGVG